MRFVVSDFRRKTDAQFLRSYSLGVQSSAAYFARHWRRSARFCSTFRWTFDCSEHRDMASSSPAAGFTLIEVTIATSLLVVIALGSAQLFVLAIRHNVAARQQLVMALSAGRKADEVCAAAAAGPVSLSPSDALDRPADGFTDVSVEGGVSCARRWLVSRPVGYATGALAVVVRVSVAGVGAAGMVQIVTVCEAGS
jgi:prepilin-type N-terminal cleavage/methylation domain-containing protein